MRNNYLMGVQKFFLLAIIVSSLSLVAFGAETRIYQGTHTKISEIALEKLALEMEFSQHTLDDFQEKGGSGHKLVLIDGASNKEWIRKLGSAEEEIKAEGYQLLLHGENTYIIGGDERGLMYGILDLRDHIRMGGSLETLTPKTEHANFHFRAIKFNLPWSPYRTGESLYLHMETVKDTVFWEGFLDMMADNRFNALTLWNLHPFTFMIQPENFPEAIEFTGQEFADWQKFWRTLFRMAKERGIETYILNWNIITSPGMTEAHDVANYKDDLEWHYGFTPADTSRIIVDYMRQCITQVINEYPNLTGLGVSLGERMKMPVEDVMQWVKDTFVEGMRQADRRVKFIHRAPFSVSPEVAREYIESYTDFPDPIIMEFKFNWSHGHSSPYLSITHGGKIADQYWNPKPSTYQMAWMMRNEDFLMLNWGNTDFIREHVAVNGLEDIVAGYFVGSETYIPAKEFRMNPEISYNWTYAYEKQWEFYQQWGRLLYNPSTPDEYFIRQFELRYGEQVGADLFKALKLGSRMPLELASFYQGTWDFTLYCEGFLNGKQLYRNFKEAGEAFIRVDEMITHPTLDRRYLNVDEFVDLKLDGTDIPEKKITPLDLANRMESIGRETIDLCKSIEALPAKDELNFLIELNDAKSWGHLSLYFAEKLRGAICLDEAIKTGDKELQALAVKHLESAASHWEGIMESTTQYQEVTLLHIRNRKFSWRYFYPKVLKDIEIANEAL